MNENTVIITEKDGKYQIENNGISEFALLGILECIVFDMKSANRAESLDTTKDVKTSDVKTSISTKDKETVQESNAPELRTRISNAIKAIRSLGGQVPEFDSNNATDKELQEELEILTEQYKRLKNSKGANK